MAPRILLVLSGKGGVGKSSVTTQLALSLTLKGRSVGVLDLDLTGPSMPRLLGIEDAKITQAAEGLVPVQVHSGKGGWENRRTERVGLKKDEDEVEDEDEERRIGGSDGRDDTTIGTTNNTDAPLSRSKIDASAYAPLSAISLGLVLPTRSTAVIWRGPKKTAMVRQFLQQTTWPANMDYLLVDTPPGTSDEHISLLETLLAMTTTSGVAVLQPRDGSDTDPSGGKRAVLKLSPTSLAGAVIVTTPQAIALSDVKKSLDFCAKTGVKVRGVVENMSGYVCPHCRDRTDVFGRGGGEELARANGLPFLGRVPIDPDFVGLVEGWDGVVEVGEDEDDDSEESDSDGENEGSVNKGNWKDEGAKTETVSSLSGPEHHHQHNHGPAPAPATKPTVDRSAPLVEKYASCSLAPIFSSIVDTLLADIEETNSAPRETVSAPSALATTTAPDVETS